MAREYEAKESAPQRTATAIFRGVEGIVKG